MGLFWLILSIITNIIDDVFLGFIILNSNNPLSTMPIWYFVAFLGGIVLLFFNKFKLKNNLDEFYKNKKILFFYLLWSILGATFWFLTIKELGVGGNAIIGNLQIFIVLVYSFFVLKEKISKKQIFFGIIMIIGIFVFSYSGYENTVLGLVYGLLCMIATSLKSIWHKKLANCNLSPDFVVVLRALTICILLSLLLLIFDINFFIPGSNLVLFILILGAISGPIFHKYSTIKALKFYNLSFFTLINLLVPVIIFLLGVFLYHEPMNAYSIIGGTMIISGSFFIKNL